MQSHEDTLLLDVEISPVANSWTLLASRSNPSPALFASLRSNRSKNQQSHVANSLRARAWASYRPRDSRAQKLATAVQFIEAVPFGLLLIAAPVAWLRHDQLGALASRVR